MIMKTVAGKPVAIYAENVEASAMEQFYDAMKQDFAVQGALMPDAHTGYSLPIGAVVATKYVIVPSWIGYDIGCGMCAMPTTFAWQEIVLYAKEIFAGIYQSVPVGFNKNAKKTLTKLMPTILTERGQEAFRTRGDFYALGTLGSGNHFIEIGVDREKKVWVIVHSGSRGVGHGVATAYMKLASPDGKAREGHFSFADDSENGRDYIKDMNWCLEYALENRYEIARRVVSVIGIHCEGRGRASWPELINRNHNHAELRDGLWIHRKGATHAEKDMMGVIPGNMRDGAFIVRGKGNPDALYSSSHGAGRTMGRGAAKRTLDVDAFKNTMSGITAKVGAKTLDESPMAYKDIFEVMKLQESLVDTVAYVQPLINVKG